MRDLKRRSLLGGATAAAAAIGTDLPRPALAADATGRTLRFIPQASLSSLDPVWTTASVTTAHGYAVYDTLYGLDASLRPQPQMAEGHEVSDDGLSWRIRLREGLLFHDGEPVRAVDCIASLIRWSKRDSFGQMFADAVDAWEAPDDRTVRIRLKRPFPLLPDALAKPMSAAAFIMPERLARTDANTQVSEAVGSGPFRFRAEEFVPGSRVVYERFDRYAPRPEPASFTAGGKRAFFDCVEWSVIPDAATAAAALQNNEADWWELALPDLVSLFRGRSEVALSPVDDLGFISLLRFNATVPPFNCPRLRAVVLGAVDQADYMHAVNGDARKWRQCAAMFPCGSPFVSEIGAAKMSHLDIDRSREAIRQAGYNGERVVILNPADFPSVGALGEVTADLLRRLGMQVDLQEMDWGTVIQRRTSRAPIDAGGLNIFHTYTTGVSIINPAENLYARGQGDTGWFGWYKSDAVERATADWLGGSTDDQRQAAFDTFQRAAFDTAPIMPLGQYYPLTAYRSGLTGRIPSAVPLFWNVRRA